MSPNSLTMKKNKTKKTGRVYRGRQLLQIAMPLGGIGAGCICLNGYGGLQDFSIRHAPATSAGPDRHEMQDAAFALLRLPEQGLTRLVEGPFPPEKIYNQGLKSQGYNGSGHEGLPRFRACSFRGAYPFGTVHLSDPDLPIAVEITGFNPFIPLDDVSSGLPCAILEYTLHNRSERPVPYQFSYHLSHLAQKGIQSSPRSAPLPGLGVSYWNEEAPFSPTRGSAALGVLHGDPSIKARWFRGGWFDAISALWREVSGGQFQPNAGLEPGATLGRNGGSILLEGVLAPGEAVTYPLVIAWHFPNIGGQSSGLIQIAPVVEAQNSFESAGWKPFYAAHWNDAVEVLRFVQANYASLRQRTQAFHDALFSSSLPPVALEAISANLAILKSPTVLRHASGQVWAWEGCFCDQGCCPGSCTHVWNYAQSMPQLFPALERTLRQKELEESMDGHGHINFRAAPPGLPTDHNFHAAADGQLGGIIKVFREWQICGDRAWLERMYPLAKRSMDFCIENWDPRRTGLPEEPHHNTYDIEFWGPDGLCSSFYIGALAALAALARDAGYPEQAQPYADLAQRGAEAIERQLFNGEYYEQKVLTTGQREESFARLLQRPLAELSDEERLLRAEGPKYQVGSGCLSDGVFGAWLARIAGVDSPQSSAHIRSHLEAVFRHNFKPSLWSHANVQRPGYALGDEPGLLLCTWPRQGKPTLPFVYSDEVWTGIEYQVASHLIAEGLVEQGLAIVKGVRARYDGHVRNPWNEYECGNYYARAMASYGLLFAYSGFRYAAPSRSLSLAPQVEAQPFTCFFSSASAWGTCTLRESSLEIELVEGELALDQLQITRRGQVQTYHPQVVCRAGERQVIRISR